MTRSLPRTQRTRRIIALTIIVGFLGSATVAHGQGRSSAKSPAASITEISRVAAEFSQRYMRGDAQGMADLYTEGGVIFPSGRPMIRGRAAIAAYWTLAPNVKVLEHKTTADSVIVVGNTAYDYGTFRAVNARDGQAAPAGYGKYVIVWQRQPDGRWLMHLDIWNGSPAPAP